MVFSLVSKKMNFLEDRVVASCEHETCRSTVGRQSADRFFGELFFTITKDLSRSADLRSCNHEENYFFNAFETIIMESHT